MEDRRFNGDDAPTLEDAMVQLALLRSELRLTAADRVRIEQRVALALRGVAVMPATDPTSADGDRSNALARRKSPPP